MSNAARLWLVALSLILLNGFLAIGLEHTAVAEQGGLIAVSDYVPPSKVRVFDPSSGMVVFDYLLRRDGPAVCRQEDVVCGQLGFHHLTYRGTDYLDTALTVIDPLAGNLADGFYSIIQRVRMVHPVQEVWRLRNLDFSQVVHGDYYCREAADPEAARTDPRCQIAFSHAFQVVDDRPEDQVVTLVVADTMNQRVVQVTLDYAEGNTVGRVDWVLGRLNPAWHPMGVPNAVQVIDEPDGRYLLVTLYSTCFRPLGSGMIQMFRWEDGDWHEMWRFPDPDAGDQPYLNTPHRGKLLTDPLTGERRIWYSHSRGLADDWHEMIASGLGATWGMLIPGETLADPPVYALDAAPFLDGDEQPVTFSRDQAYLPDGTIVLADSACESLCRYRPRILRVGRSLQNVPPDPEKTGCYTYDHEELNLVEIPDSAVLDTYQCGIHGIFEVEWLTDEELGTQLKAAQPVMRCPPM